MMAITAGRPGGQMAHVPAELSTSEKLDGQPTPEGQ
jgi:hypothetical protein